jgi:heptosyltransferase-3
VKRIDRAPSASRTRILLIVDDCGAGDALRMSFCLERVRRQFPLSELVLLVGEEAYPAFERSRIFDRIVISHLYKRHGQWDGPNRSWKLRQVVILARQLGAGYDLLVAFNWGSTLLHILMWLVGRKGRRVGYSRSFASLLTDNLGPYQIALAKLNFIQQNLALLRAAGVDATIAPPVITSDPVDQVEVDRLLEMNGVLASRSIIVLHPGSHWPCQQWRPERWSKLADELFRRYVTQIVFTGDAREHDQIHQIRARMRTPSTSLAGQTTLVQLAVLLSRSQLCVCVNSAVFEVTQSTGVPTVVLAGPSEPHVVSTNGRSPIIINQTPAETRIAINRSRRRFVLEGHPECSNYECSLAYLPDIQVAGVVNAIDRMLQASAVTVR